MEKTAVKKEKRLSPGVIVCIAAAAAGAGSLLLYFLLRGNTAFANGVKTRFSLPVRRLLGRICALVPFSVTEFLVAAVIAGAVAFIVYLSVCAGKKRLSRKKLLLRAAAGLLAAVHIFSLYCWLYGIDYRASSFAERAGLNSAGVSAAALADVTKAFALRAGELAAAAPRDEAGAYAVSARDVMAKYGVLYHTVEAEFPFLAAESYRPKPLISSVLMSATGFSGVYFPFTGESSINVHMPAFSVGATTAHELAHQRGVTSEQECNFLGILACLTCGDDDYAYSGAYTGLTFLLNALYSADYDAWQEVCTLLTPELLRDIRAGNEYWQSFSSPVSDASEKVYDAYLVGNGESLGIRSYGACVDLLVAWFAERPV